MPSAQAEGRHAAPRRLRAMGSDTSSIAEFMTAARPLNLHPDRLFPSDPTQRAIARRLYAEVAGLPIVSPHGHTDPAWWAVDAPFANATELLLVPDHYVFRMLYSQGIDLDALGIPRADGSRAPCCVRACPACAAPATTTCSAAPLPHSGATTSSTRSSACASACAPTAPTATTTRSPMPCRPRRSARGRCSSVLFLMIRRPP